MKLLDEKGLKTVWSTCKTKFALAGHTHNYAGSVSPGGSANSAIGVVDYGQTSKTIQIGYSGTGITGDQIKYIAGYTDGSGNVNAKIKDVSKDALRAWLGLGSLAYSSSSIPTNLSQLNNDKGFVTGSVSGNTITINGVSTTWANTWRGIQDNLISYSTSDSLSANQGRILKGLIDGKANSSHTHNWSQISGVPVATKTQSGIMSSEDKSKLDGIASDFSNVCKFNFINSISECQNGKINFFFKMFTSYDMVLDIKDFENCEEGTILLLNFYNPNHNYVRITNSAHNWYFKTKSSQAGEYRSGITGYIMLATIKSGEIHVFTY